MNLVLLNKSEKQRTDVATGANTAASAIKSQMKKEINGSPTREI